MTLTLSARRLALVLRQQLPWWNCSSVSALAFTLVCNFLLEFASPKESSQKWRKIPRNTQAATAAAAQLSGEREAEGQRRLRSTLQMTIATELANMQCRIALHSLSLWPLTPSRFTTALRRVPFLQSQTLKFPLICSCVWKVSFVNWKIISSFICRVCHLQTAQLDQVDKQTCAGQRGNNEGRGDQPAKQHNHWQNGKLLT